MNSSGSDDVGAAGPSGVAGGMDCGTTGPWNIRMNSSGSDDGGASRVGGRGGTAEPGGTSGGTGGRAAAGEPPSGRFQKPALPNSCGNPAA